MLIEGRIKSHIDNYLNEHRPCISGQPHMLTRNVRLLDKIKYKILTKMFDKTGHNNTDFGPPLIKRTPKFLNSNYFFISLI